MKMNDFKRYIPANTRDIVKEYAYNYVTSNVKEKFGTEFYLRRSTFNINGNKNKLRKFFNKLINNFDKRAFDKVTNSLKNDIFIATKIDNGTFILITAGLYSSSIVKKGVLTNDDSYIDSLVYVYVFGKKSPKYANILLRIYNSSDNDSIHQSIYTVSKLNDRDSNVNYLSLNIRNIDTIFFSNSEVEKVTSFIDKYNDNEAYYKDLELSYKTGILLYGNPGTGKSSLVKTLAHKYNRDICQVDVTKIDEIDLSLLTNLINNDENVKYIVLFEDIDTMMLDREGLDQNNETVKKYKDNVNKLLQFLDSSSSPNNVIFIATTNYYDKLDKALIRDGRFDLKLELKELEKKDLPRYMNYLKFDGTVDEVIEAYGENNGTFNQSKLQNTIISLRG